LSTISEQVFLCERESRTHPALDTTPLAFDKKSTTASYLLPKNPPRDTETWKAKGLAKMTSPNSKVLVYLHRHNGNNPIVADGLTVMTTSDLDNILVNSKYSHKPRT